MCAGYDARGRKTAEWGTGTQPLPVSYTHLDVYKRQRWRDCYNGNIRLAGPELSNAWCVHLWGEMARREPDAWANRGTNNRMNGVRAADREELFISRLFE